MNTERPREVTAHHLGGWAGIYARQSSERQVEKNAGSMEYQRRQERWPLAWGWQPDRIKTYIDPGLSGTAAAHRPEFLKLVDDVKAKRLRAIFAADQSRLARNAVEWIEFLTLCRIHAVILAIDGRIIHTGHDGDAFSSSILALVDEFENRKRNTVFERGRLGKIAAGRAITTPPTGYIARKDGGWDLDPDKEIQLAIAEVFRVFLEQRSSARTVRSLLAADRRIPRRKPGREVYWSRPTVGMVLSIVRNPVYGGQYLYRRRTADEARGRDRRGHTRIRVTTPDEQIEIPDHHAPYISSQQAEEIRAILKANAPNKHRRNLGPGAALLQGIVGCGKHVGRAMGVDYRCSGRSGPHYYHCHGDYDLGGSQCWVVPGRQLDFAVAQAVFERLAPPELEAIRAEWAAAQHDAVSRQAGKALTIDQARRRAEDLRARYALMNPALRNLAETIEAELDEALGEYRRLQLASVDTSGEDFFTERTFDELIMLCQDLPAIFYADTTAHRDRKEILRMMIERVVVTAASPESLSFSIRWVDGSAATDGVALLARYAHALIRKMAADGTSNPEIAQRLNELGLKTTRGRHWTTSTVWQVQDYEFRKPALRSKGQNCIERIQKGEQKQRTAL